MCWMDAPKSEGIRMLIRSMAPQVVAADEIGTAADVQALEEALQSGVRIIINGPRPGLAGSVQSSRPGASGAAGIFCKNHIPALAGGNDDLTV